MKQWCNVKKASMWLKYIALDINEVKENFLRSRNLQKSKGLWGEQELCNHFQTLLSLRQQSTASNSKAPEINVTALFAHTGVALFQI